MALRRLSRLILLAMLAVAGDAAAQSAKIVPLDRVLVVVSRWPTTRRTQQSALYSMPATASSVLWSATE